MTAAQDEQDSLPDSLADLNAEEESGFRTAAGSGHARDAAGEEASGRVQSAFAEVEVLHPGNSNWAAPLNSPTYLCEHLQPLSAEEWSQPSMQPDTSPLLKSEALNNSSEGPIGGHDLNARSTPDSACDEHPIETQLHCHDKAVIAQQQIGVASGKPRGRRTHSSSTSDSSTSNRNRMRSPSYSNSSSSKGGPERASSVSHSYAPSKSPEQHSQLVSTPLITSPFMGHSRNAQPGMHVKAPCSRVRLQRSL